MSVKEIYVPSENPKNTRFHEVEVLTGQKFIRAYSPFIGDNGNWFIYDDQKKIYVDTNVKAQGTVHLGDLDSKINTPKNSDGTISNGISGQILQTNGDGTTQWVKPSGSTSTEGTIEETDPTVSDWAKQPEKPSYTAEEVGADASGTAVAKVSEHNTASNAHNDIRLLVQGLTERLNALADSDDTTLDQMSEVVAYVKSNKSLIDAITTSKVNVSDIIDNLTTNVSNKPLSAAQGVKLKALIDAIIVPTKLSELENDSGYVKTTDIPDKLPNPQKLTFDGSVTAEYDGSGAVTVTIPEGSGGSGGTVRIEKLSTDTAVELEPNKLYIFPEMSELTITLAEPSDTGIANEYHFVFQSGATATTLSIPDTVKLPSNFSVDASKIYEVSILEGCLCAQGWAVTA